MINTIGVIGGLLFFLKFFLHLYLMTKVDKKFLREALVSTSVERFQTFFPFFADVPKKLKWLKLLTNIIYGVSMSLIIIFIIGVNIK